MDKYRVGINMLVAAAILRALILCTPLGWLAIIRLFLNIACLAIVIGGLWYLYQATGGQKITNGLIAMVAYRVVLGIIHSIVGGIITLVIVVCALCYLRVYKYEDILKFVKQ